MQASLVMFKADGERREFPIEKPITVVGRKINCDLRIPLSSVSRQHFQVEKRDDGIFVRDLGSSNGTFYNDTRVQEAQLHPGDELRVGPVHFTVIIDGQPANIEPVTTVLPHDTEVHHEPGLATDAVDSETGDTLDAVEMEPLTDEDIVEEQHSPTTDLDDDGEDDDDNPFAELESMDEMGSGNLSDIPLFLDEEEDPDNA